MDTLADFLCWWVSILLQWTWWSRALIVAHWVKLQPAMTEALEHGFKSQLCFLSSSLIIGLECDISFCFWFTFLWMWVILSTIPIHLLAPENLKKNVYSFNQLLLSSWVSATLVGGLKWSFWVLHSAWSRPGYCSHFKSESVNLRFFSVSSSWCCSTSQINI